MSKKNITQPESKTMLLVPLDFLTEIREQQNKILETLSTKFQPKETFGDYISESEAKKILGRKTTWFWNLRKQGKIPFTKVGAKIFYSKAEVLSFIEANKKVIA